MQLCSFLYRMVFAMDGNYSLHKKTKEGDADDVALAEGQNFFVPKSLIEPHLEAAKNKPKRRQAAKAHNSGATDADGHTKSNKGQDRATRQGTGKGMTKGKGKARDGEDRDDEDDDPVGTTMSIPNFD